MLDPLLPATAIEAALKAGRLQMERFGSGLRVDKKGTIDLVTEVDVAIERMFRALIGERFPDHAILAEEMGGPGPGMGPCWVFDPIDGTTNYAHGLPFFCASVGFEIDGRVEVGVVYDPVREELFTAERGGGAFLNGAPIRVSDTGALIDGLLCTGFPYDIHQRVDELVELFRDFLARARAVRRLGSAALDLCYLAAGRFDGFWEQSLKPWDTAAGVLVIEEAGGRVTGWDGEPFRIRDGSVVASNGRLHSALLSTIAAYQERSVKRTR